MKHLLFFAAALFFLQGCICKCGTYSQVTLYNNTAHSIKIYCYRTDTIRGNDTFLLDANTRLTVETESIAGRKVLTSGPFASPFIGQPQDSNVVVFDDTLRMVHYLDRTDTPGNLAARYYLYNSGRNIANPNNYQVIIKKGGSIREYYFTEQDYLDAKH